MSFLMNSFFFNVAGGLEPPPTTSYAQSSEGLTEVTEATGAAWTELASLDLTGLVTDETYLIFYSLEVSCTSTGTCAHELMDDGVTAVGHVQKMKETSSPTDYMGLLGMYSFVATGPTKTLALRIQRGSGAGTASAKNGRLTSLILGADDVISTSAGLTTTTSGTYATKTSITFTPPTTGDYLILAMGNLQGIGGSRPHFRINDGSTTWSYGTQFGDVAAGDFYPALFLSEQLALSGSKTFDLEFASIATSDLCGIKDAVLVALRLDRFVNSYITALGTADSANVAVYTDTALTQTFTPAAGSHLTICGFGMSGNSSSSTGYLKYVDGADGVMESVREHVSTAATILMPGGAHGVANYTAASRTQKVQRNAESTNIVTVSENSIIATIEMTRPVAPSPIVPLLQATAIPGSTTSTVVTFDNPPNLDDIIIVYYSIASNNGSLPTIVSSGYETIIRQRGDDTIDTRTIAVMKVSDGTETSIEVGETYDTAYAGVALIAIVDGVNTTNPLDVVASPATGSNSYNPNPASITPFNSGAVILAMGAGCRNTSGLTSSDLTDFTSVVSEDTADHAGGIGYHAWTSGAFDPAAFGGGSPDGNAAWTALTIALRPTDGVGADANFNDVAFLYGFEGVNGETTGTEESPNAQTVTCTGGDISTDQAKFGASSYNTILSTSNAAVPDNVDFDFGSGSFTIEGWIYPTSNIGSSQHLIGQWDSAGNQKSWAIYKTNTNLLNLLLSTDGSTTTTKISVTSAFTLNVWTHFAADFDGTTYRLYNDGVMVGSATTGLALHDSTADFTVMGQSASGFSTLGYMDEVRITKGVARYATDTSFTVPTLPFPRS